MNLGKLNVRRLAGALALLLALSLALVPAIALAATPEMSHIFYGTVTTEDGAAAVGTVITARVASLEYTTTVDSEGKYGYEPLFRIPVDDPETDEVDGASDGDPIEFYVGETKAQLYDVVAGEWLDSYPFESQTYTKLNLSIGEAPLTAEAGGPYSGTVGEEIALSGNATGGTSPYDYAWDLDNDEVYDDSDAQNPSYIWDTAGTYTIELQVTDDASDTDTDEATVVVTEEGAFDPYFYDENGDGEFSKEETLAAVNDYLDETIGVSDALAVVKLYFLSP